ncbi:hypothetical protein EJ08DRAFT_645321 [Tothia fuscella]|uniref:Uncharacterized protein n=1 Tax=Tothia fuscella TaxID=1048955 RepID=A0A9P4U3H2_9PEZI|nr:hypothetical protein EJ08DRAFT_645321 [Tothia fuscella]
MVAWQNLLVPFTPSCSFRHAASAPGYRSTILHEKGRRESSLGKCRIWRKSVPSSFGAFSLSPWKNQSINKLQGLELSRLDQILV